MTRLYLTMVAILIGLLSLLMARPAYAEPGEELMVAVITYGPGDEAFDKFGHNALWVHDSANDDDYIYNFGTYHFDSSDILIKFWVGRFKYWLSVRKSLDGSLRNYRRENRTAVAHVLELTQAQKLAIFARLKENAKPANRYYKYDYYRDNCTTRVRDAVDDAIGGRLREASRGPGKMTYRQHTLRLTASLLPEYVVLHLVMGGLIDKPLDEWAEMFLPGTLAKGLERTRVVAADGSGEVPLIKENKILLTANRPAEPDSPPRWLPYFALTGLSAGGALAGLGFLASNRRGRAIGAISRIALGVLLALFGFVFGFLGCFYLFAWGFTDHEVAYANENLLQCTPWVIALLVLGLGVAFGWPGAMRKAMWLAMAALAASGLGFMLKVLPWFYQDNWQVIAMLLPLWGGATLGLRALTRDAPQSEVQ